MIRKIGEVMTRNVITVKKGTSIIDVVKLMAKHGISCVIVVDSSYRVCGIATERDMVRRVLNNSVDPHTTKIDDVMSSPVMTISPENKITAAINDMQKYHFRRAVIADRSGRLMGVLTQSDLLSEVHRVQKELEKMNENLKNTVKSIQRYSKIDKKDSRIISLKKKINKLEKALEESESEKEEKDKGKSRTRN